MRNFILLAVIFVAMTIDSVRMVYPDAPRQVGYISDAVIAVMSIFLISRIIADKSWSLIPARYILVFLGFVYVCVAGVVLNGVSGDTVFAGVRVYFRYVPMFLLPFAFDYSDREWTFHLKFILLILLVQIPVTLYQRVVQFEAIFTGDVIGGTYGSSTTIAILSSIGVLFLLTWYLHGRLSAGKTALFSLALLIPPGLAETKVTPILLLLGGLAIVWNMRKSLSAKRIVFIGILGLAGISIFSGLYSYLYSRSDGSGYFDIMVDPDRNYHYTDVETPKLELPRKTRTDLIARSNEYEPVGEEEEGRLGRIDSIRMPFEALLPDEPLYFALGLGIGNVTSDFGSGGAYKDLHLAFSVTQTTINHLIWETGITGCLLFIAFLFMLTRDCLRASPIARSDDALLASAMWATCATMWFCLAYTSLWYKPELMVPFIYFAGLIVANTSRAHARQFDERRIPPELTTVPGRIVTNHSPAPLRQPGIAKSFRQ